MKKIIVKVKSKTPKKIIKELTDIEYKISDSYWIHDRVYTPRNYSPSKNFPRLIMRTEMRTPKKPAKYSLILKRHIEDSGIDISETTNIKDYSEMVNIILQLGFERFGEVARRRQEINIDKNTIVYIDRLDSKPDECYIKIESVLHEGDSVESVRNDLRRTLKMFGENDFLEKSYVEM